MVRTRADEAALLKLAADGDERAFTELVEVHRLNPAEYPGARLTDVELFARFGLPAEPP